MRLSRKTEEFYRRNTIKAAKDEIERIKVEQYVERKKKLENQLKQSLNKQENDKMAEIALRKQIYNNFWEE